MYDAQSVLDSFLPRVHSLDSRQAVFQLQFDLLDSLSAYERRISEIRDKQYSPEPLEETELSKALILHMGDSVAWQLLEREFIRGSYIATKGGYVTFRSGFDAELAAFRLIHEQWPSEVAILNDLTRCLGIGDITVVGPRAGVIEVKSSYAGATADRALLQKERMKWLAEYSAVDQGDLPIPPDKVEMVRNLAVTYGKPVRSRRIHTESEDQFYHRLLSDLIEDAAHSASGWATASLSGYGGLAVMRKDKAVDDTDLPKLMSDLRRHSDDRLLLGSVNRLVWDFADLLPLPLFDMSEESQRKILAEEVVAIVAYPLENLVEALEERGLRRVEGRRQGLILQDGKSGAQLQVLDYPLRRLVYEMLSVDSFVDTVVTASTAFSEDAHGQPPPDIRGSAFVG